MTLINSPFVIRLAAGVMAMNLIVFGLAGYSIYTSKMQYENQARITTENLARSLEFSVSGILDNIDLALSVEKTEAERHLSDGGIRKTLLDAHIAGTLNKVPEMANLRLANAKGDILYGVNTGSGTVANVADRDYFIFLRDNPNLDMYISKPLLGRISKKWIIIVARRVNNPDGSFAGVIHGNIQIELIQKHFATFDLGKHGMITLRDKDLTIIVRYPETEKSTPGNFSATSEFARKIQAGQSTGTYQIKSKVDGIDRVISYRKVDRYPLYINCGLASQDYLAAWKNEAAKLMALVVLFILCTVAGSWAIIHAWKQKQFALNGLKAARDELELRVAERTEELKTSNENLLEQSTQLQTEVANRQDAQEELTSKNKLLEQEMAIRKRAEEERLKMEEQMLHVQKLESMGVLAGGIAHDFNNILTAIVGNADLALMRLNPESPVVEHLQRIETAAGRASDLAKQMLAYSGKGKFIIESIDLNRLIEEMLHMLEVSISKKAVLRLNLHHSIPTVDADATQLRQIIMNLVINASEAIGDKSGIISISTGCMQCDRNYLKEAWLDEKLPDGLYDFFEIADSGCGIDRETLKKIFDPFFTTKFTGRGLGMAAVLGIVRGHKGTIKVYSEPGKGSSFKILLPAVNRPIELFDAHQDAIEWSGAGLVLLVDDEETIRALGSEMLEELGFQTITAEDGRQALEIYKDSNNNFNFVILDLTMPHMDGEQTLREIRRINPDARVIISSGFNEQEVAQQFVGKGLSGFIQKPYKLSGLKEVIRKLSI